MPGYRVHLVAGLCVFLVMWSLYYPYATHIAETYSAIGCLSTLLGAILPDCDTRSAGRNILNIAILPLCALSAARKLYLMCVYLVTFWGVTRAASHRGVTHTLWFPVVCVSLLAMYGFQHNLSSQMLYWGCGGLFAGYLSHILLDRLM